MPHRGRCGGAGSSSRSSRVHTSRLSATSVFCCSGSMILNCLIAFGMAALSVGALTSYGRFVLASLHGNALLVVGIGDVELPKRKLNRLVRVGRVEDAKKN